MNSTRPGSLLTFFFLVPALSIPFWVIGGSTELHLMPGPSLTALAAFCFLLAAPVLVD